MPEPDVRVPAYGSASLADLTPSLLHALGLAEFPNPLAVESLRGVCLLLIDDLGYELLMQHRREAPFLSAAAAVAPLTAGFPSTTPVSLSSIGTGLPPGEHGVIGY